MGRHGKWRVKAGEVTPDAARRTARSGPPTESASRAGFQGSRALVVAAEAVACCLTADVVGYRGQQLRAVSAGLLRRRWRVVAGQRARQAAAPLSTGGHSETSRAISAAGTGLEK